MNPVSATVRWLGVASGLAALTAAAPTYAEPGPEHSHRVEVRHGYPRAYGPVVVARERFYRARPIIRFYGPLYPGFGYFYSDAAAFAFLGLTAWQLAIYADLREEQLRAQEAALVQATSGPINEPIIWNDGPASGTVIPLRDGRTADGRACREFQQEISVGGKTEQAHGTACQEPDGSWKIVNNTP